MATGLPPPPINDQPGSFTWLEWYRQLRDYISTNGSVPWYIINFAGSNITDIATRDHDQLQNLDGGTAGEHYHLTAAEYASLTAGDHNDLTGLQGGTTAQYYHLTAAQYNVVAAAGAIRETVTSSRTYYVRTDGSDSNNGLTNTAGGAFLTIQKAVDVISSSLDIASGVVVTVQVGDGTYTLTNSLELKALSGPGTAVIQGNNTTPSNVLINGNNVTAIISYVGGWELKSFKITTTTSGRCLQVSQGGFVRINNLDFGATGATTQAHILIDITSKVLVMGSYTISGSAYAHVQADHQSFYESWTGTITLTGTPAFTAAFIYLSGLSSAHITATTFSGSATGSRYSIALNSVIFTNGAGINYLPGNAAGTTATGAQYA